MSLGYVPDQLATGLISHFSSHNFSSFHYVLESNKGSGSVVNYSQLVRGLSSALPRRCFSILIECERYLLRWARKEAQHSAVLVLIIVSDEEMAIFIT
jgi:DNA-binding LacI/PurR family transcriptional regulator